MSDQPIEPCFGQCGIRSLEARCADLQAENAVLKEEFDNISGHCSLARERAEKAEADLTALRAERDAAQAQCASAERALNAAWQALETYGQHRPPCKADYCAVCNRNNDARTYGGSMKGWRGEDGDCTNDKHGLHDFEPLACTCGFAAALTHHREGEDNGKRC